MSAKCQYTGASVSGPNCVFQSSNAEILFVRSSDREFDDDVVSFIYMQLLASQVARLEVIL